MARKKQTPTHLINLITRAIIHGEYVTEILRVKANVPVENQAEHVTRHTAEYWITLHEGYNTAVEDALHEYGCYHGFSYLVATPQTIDGSDQKFTPTCGPDHPEFAEWRRKYHIR